MSSKSRCRSYKASLSPENRIGPRPYWVRRSGTASDRRDRGEGTSLGSFTLSCLPSNGPVFHSLMPQHQDLGFQPPS